MTHDFRAIMRLRASFSTEERGRLGILGDRFHPSGEFRSFAPHNPASEVWRTFFDSSLRTWSPARRVAAVVMLAPEVYKDRDVLAPRAGGRRLNTILAWLGKVGSGAVGNAVRASKLEPPEMFRSVLLGDQPEFAWVISKRRLIRHPVVKRISALVKDSIVKLQGKISLLLVNSDVGDDLRFFDPGTVSTPAADIDPMVIGDTIKLGGYVAWLRRDPDMELPEWYADLYMEYQGTAQNPRGVSDTTGFSECFESTIRTRTGAFKEDPERPSLYVSVLSKVLRNSTSIGGNLTSTKDGLLDFEAMGLQTAFSEANAYHRLMRHLCGKRRRWVLTVSKDRRFLGLLRKAARSADQWLLRVDPH